MTIKFLDLYNEVAEQAWSMYDSDVTTKDEFESALKSSIQKALSELWNSYKFPFRLKTYKIKTRKNKNDYNMPDGKIFKQVVNQREVYPVKYGKTYLKYIDNYEELDIDAEKGGEPTGFYIKGDRLYIYPMPDNVYNISVDYYTYVVGLNEEDEDIYTLQEEKDYIDIPEKYEIFFKNALKTLSLAYSIADVSDENYEQYMIQYERAYKLLIDSCEGLDFKKRIVI